MKREKWEEALKAWQRVKDQAEIDIAQADLYTAAINTHLNTNMED
jgi:hypothetical protein